MPRATPKQSRRGCSLRSACSAGLPAEALPISADINPCPRGHGAAADNIAALKHELGDQPLLVFEANSLRKARFAFRRQQEFEDCLCIVEGDLTGELGAHGSRQKAHRVGLVEMPSAWNSCSIASQGSLACRKSRPMSQRF